MLAIAPDNTTKKILLQGFEKAYQGRPLSGIPQELTEQLANIGGGSLSLKIRQGNAEAIDQALEFLADSQADVGKKIELIEVLGEIRHQASIQPLLAILASSDDQALCSATLTTLQHFEAPQIANQILTQYSKLPAESTVVAITTLASRASWSRALLEAVDAGTIAQDAIPLDSVRRMTMHEDQTIASLVSKHWHSLQGKSSQQMKQQLTRVEKILSAGGGNPYAGKKLFLESCSKCHLLFGKGGRIGPDLTAYKRDDTARMLLNIINPSAEIREGFETYLILTDDGRAVSGFLFDQDKNVVVLRGADGQNLTIARQNIEEMRRQPLSLMPEDLLTPTH